MRKPILNRRSFVRDGTLLLLTGAVTQGSPPATDAPPVLQIGMVTDLHHADKDARGTRHYRESLGKLEEAGRVFAEQRVDMVIELGDFIDSASSLSAEKRHLKEVQSRFSQLPGDRHHVLGNHCVHQLTKEEFLGGVEREVAHYSFDLAGFHFVILDACFRSDGVDYERNNFQWTDSNIPPAELEWLRADLKATRKPTLVMAHQRLDRAEQHAVKNAGEVRAILEASGVVRAVFQGHSHRNDHQEINRIHYATLVAMVEGTGAVNNGYSILRVLSGGELALTGFRNQLSRTWG